jgi:DNA-binding MarR family transcriptional regulator
MRTAKTLGGGEIHLTVIQVLAFLEVALNPGIMITDLADKLEVEASTASRAVDVLGTHGRRGRKGLGLMRRRDHPGDRRIQLVDLTTKGHAALKALV